MTTKGVLIVLTGDTTQQLQAIEIGQIDVQKDDGRQTLALNLIERILP